VSLDSRVRRHFDADAERFDAIYEADKGPLAQWVDDVWRGVVRRRFELTLERVEPISGRSFLDVGCGSGRYCLAFAERGASRVVGVDFAERMIRLARERAERMGLSDRCEFRAGGFPEAVPDGPFDLVTALGFFDYVADPVPMVGRLRELARSTMVMSFPKAREWRVPLRRLRFLMAGCPLHLYSETRCREILGAAGVKRYEWVVLDRDYVVIASI
jgi:2-polyprenyl-3-methyl-5-hydroxy-6-metoxy-1,4-benzoquinol methylase